MSWSVIKPEIKGEKYKKLNKNYFLLAEAEGKYDIFWWILNRFSSPLKFLPLTVESVSDFILNFTVPFPY